MSDWDEPRCVETEASDALQEPSLMPAVTEGEFDDFLGSSSGFVLVDFWADWCGPCQQASPILEALAEEYEGRVAFCKVNADQSPRLSRAFGVRSLPTILVLKPYGDRPGAKVVAQAIGCKTPHSYRDIINEALAPPKTLGTRIRDFLGL